MIDVLLSAALCCSFQLIKTFCLLCLPSDFFHSSQLRQLIKEDVMLADNDLSKIGAPAGAYAVLGNLAQTPQGSALDSDFETHLEQESDVTQVTSDVHADAGLARKLFASSEYIVIAPDAAEKCKDRLEVAKNDYEFAGISGVPDRRPYEGSGDGFSSGRPIEGSWDGLPCGWLAHISNGLKDNEASKYNKLYFDEVSECDKNSSYQLIYNPSPWSTLLLPLVQQRNARLNWRL
jgi:hypothetical protein